MSRFIWPCALAVLSLASPLRADLTVESWSLNSVIHDLAPGSTNPQEFVTFTTVQNPFQDSHSVNLGQSSVSASYNFGWLGDFAHFDAYTNHYLEQLDGDTSSSGRIHLVPAVDSTISFNGTWHYSWPGATIGSSDFVLDVYDLTVDEDVVRAAGSGGNVGFGQPFGTFNLQNSGSLLAGREYEVFYFARISLFTDLPPGTHGNGFGEVHFSLTPIPEPTTATLIGILLLPRKPLDRRQQRR